MRRPAGAGRADRGGRGGRPGARRRARGRRLARRGDRRARRRGRGRRRGEPVATRRRRTGEGISRGSPGERGGLLIRAEEVETGEDHPAVRGDLDDRRAVRHPADDQGARASAARPADQDRRPAGHLGKSGTPTMGGIVIIIASLVGYLVGHLVTGDPMTASGVLVLFLMTGLGPGRVRRRLHQAVHAAQPRPAQRRQAGRAGGRRRDLRGARDQLPRRLRPDPGVDAPVVPRRLRRLDRPGAVRGVGHRHGHRHLQRGEPHRRPRRPGHRRGDPGPGRLRDHRELAAAQRLHRRAGPELLRRPRPAGSGRWSPPS